MGATASSCAPLKAETTTELFTVPDYSKSARMPAGTVLNYHKFWHGYGRYRLKVYPAGFDEESAGYVAIFVAVTGFGWLRFNKGVKVCIEILDVSGERAVVFDDNHSASSEQTLVDEDGSKGYVRFVKRTELGQASCVRADDTITVRCTLSFDEKAKPSEDELRVEEHK